MSSAAADAKGEDSPLCNVRRHGLRYSAITTWQTLAVLLDTCLGVVREECGSRSPGSSKPSTCRRL
ncbi:MAG: hypothetical protein ACRDZ4_03050 [Egibacteraceae bacterium]